MKSVTLDVYTQKTVTVNNPVTEMIMGKDERDLIIFLLQLVAAMDARCEEPKRKEIMTARQMLTDLGERWSFDGTRKLR